MMVAFCLIQSIIKNRAALWLMTLHQHWTQRIAVASKPSFDFLTPLQCARRRGDDDGNITLDPFALMGHVKRRESCDCFPKTHIVTQGPGKTVLVEIKKPLDTIDLICTEYIEKGK